MTRGTMGSRSRPAWGPVRRGRMRALRGSATASWRLSSRTNRGSGPISSGRLAWSSTASRSRPASSGVAENLLGGRSANIASTKVSMPWLVIGPPPVPARQPSAGQSAV